MAAKEARARIKINKLLEEAGWRLVDSPSGKANVLLLGLGAGQPQCDYAFSRI
jgi:hypothetical protein